MQEMPRLGRKYQGGGGYACQKAYVIKVTGFVEIAALGVMSMLHLVVDKGVLAGGKVLSAERIGLLL